MDIAPQNDFASRLGYAIRSVFEYACYGVIFTSFVIFWIIT